MSSEAMSAACRFEFEFCINCPTVEMCRQPINEGAKRASMDSFLMNSVLETGVGAPIVLAIIFRAVCHRAGVRVNVAVLDGGSDCVVWPEVRIRLMFESFGVLLHLNDPLDQGIWARVAIA
jgi:hypothetical protein